MLDPRTIPFVNIIYSAEDNDLVEEESFEEPLPDPIPEPNEPLTPQNTAAEPMDVDEEPIRRPPRFLGERNQVESYIFHRITNFTSYPM